MTEEEFRKANPYYMKLVNETRQTAQETKPVQPKFDLNEALLAIDKMEARGGYGIPEILGEGYQDAMRDISSEVIRKINEKQAGKAGLTERASVASDADMEYNSIGFSGVVNNTDGLSRQQIEQVRSAIMQKYNNSLPELGYVLLGDTMYVFSGDNGDATITGKYTEAAAAEIEDEIRRLYNGQNNGGYTSFDSWIKGAASKRGGRNSSPNNIGQSGKRQQNGGPTGQPGQGTQPGGTPVDGRIHQKVLNGKYADLFAEAEVRVEPRDYVDAYRELKYQVERGMIGPKETLNHLQEMIDDIDSYGGGGKYSVQDDTATTEQTDARTDNGDGRFALDEKQQKNRDFNNSKTEVGSPLKTLQGTTIKRYRNTAGKEVGSQVYDRTALTKGAREKLTRNDPNAQPSSTDLMRQKMGEMGLERNSVASENEEHIPTGEEIQNEGVVEYYSLASNPEHLAGVNIADDLSLGVGVDGQNTYFTDLILRGIKTIETRFSPSLGTKRNNTTNGRRLADADGNGGVEVAIVSTHNPNYLGAPMVVGYMKYGEPIVYTSPEEFRKDFKRHRVPEGSSYDMKPGETKYGYPIVSARAEPNPYRVTTRGITFRDAERSEQRDWVEKNPPKQPIPAAQMIAKYGQEYYNKRGWAYAQDGPLNTTEYNSWSSDFADQAGGKNRDPEEIVVSRVGAASTGSNKIVLAKGPIEDPTIVSVAFLEDDVFDDQNVNAINEVLNDADREELERYLADHVQEALISVHDAGNDANSGSDAGRSGAEQRTNAESNSSIPDGRTSPHGREESPERSAVTEQTDARTDNGGGRSSLDDGAERYSLASVDPVEPKSDGWQRTHSTAEAMEAYRKSDSLRK